MPTSRPVQTHNTLGEILEYYSDIDDLKDEMEEWRDNMPDSLQSSDKYSQVDEAANTLDNAHGELEEACDAIKRFLEKIPADKDNKLILDTPVGYTEHKMYKGYQMPRWVRLANPCAAIEEAMQFIEDHVAEISVVLSENDMQELVDHKKQVDDALGDLQGVEFPSMFS